MICYKDTTFCDFYMECKKGDTCPRSLTPEVRAAAEKWWGSNGAPISKFTHNPSCFEDVYNTGLQGSDL